MKPTDTTGEYVVRQEQLNEMFSYHDGGKTFKIKLWSSGGSTIILPISPEEVIKIANILIGKEGQGKISYEDETVHN